MVTIESDSDFYDVFEILGKGTFGEVVKSWKRSTGEMVLKLLQTMSEVDTEAAHIVQFHEFFHDELKFYLVFELLEQNLFDFQKEHNFSPLAVRHIRTVTTQVLRALAKLKELSIIHADLKPENIMLVDQVRFPFRVKVIDFGSASIFSEVRYVKEPTLLNHPEVANSCMVELITRMLTWDSHERITPSAALKHPFISTQPLKHLRPELEVWQPASRKVSPGLSQEVGWGSPIRALAAAGVTLPHFLDRA
uniref:Homeodomain interacting protein kinase 4 n=1 Tax=Varanus komodoensis TaxID=61221 RepID=A0A8D2LRQ7_VARKO